MGGIAAVRIVVYVSNKLGQGFAYLQHSSTTRAQSQMRAMYISVGGLYS